MQTTIFNGYPCVVCIKIDMKICYTFSRKLSAHRNAAAQFLPYSRALSISLCDESVFSDYFALRVNKAVGSISTNVLFCCYRCCTFMPYNNDITEGCPTFTTRILHTYELVPLQTNVWYIRDVFKWINDVIEVFFVKQLRYQAVPVIASSCNTPSPTHCITMSFGQ